MTGRWIYELGLSLLRSWGELARLHRWAIGLLLLSGIFHLVVFGAMSLPWSSPQSMRKAVLFGLSTGVTLWSCQYGLLRWKPRAGDAWLGTLLTLALVLEVALITIQPWRGMASHFATAGRWNAAIEQAMHGCILVATLIIASFSLRAWRSDTWRELPGRLGDQRAMRWAIRIGLAFLLISCGLGFLITVIGKAQLAGGGSPELYGQAGVLKFPHGSTLHAIQTLVLIAWLGRTWHCRQPGWAVAAGSVSHLGYLMYSLGQTFQGRGRWDVSGFGLGWLSVTAAAALACWLLLCYREGPARPIAGEAAPSAGD
jgi:hypothetical protein